MNILFISAEAAPFAKVGGLGDVVAAGSLPTALRQLDVDARVILPLYGTIDRAKFNIKPQFSFYFPRSNGTAFVQVYRTDWRDVPFYFVESWPFFGEEGSVYTEWGWDMPRYIFFCQVAMAVAWELRQRQDWGVDVMHVNDWHTGLIPYFLQQSRNKPEWANVRSMITLHNMAHQGNYAGGWLWELEVPERDNQGLKYLGLEDNMLAIGVAYADYITTVSPRHAEEIQYPYMGYDLAPLVRSRASEKRLYGVLNGIDIENYDPATDPYITENYDTETFLKARKENKRRIQSFASLDQREDVPIIGLVSRLVWQKGIDIAIPALRQILTEQDVQFIALGTGDPEISEQLAEIARDFPDKARSYITYDAALAQRIYASADMFLMPSRYEPCGIGQMLAMRYGALPIVRETGGLADTVDNYDNADGEVGTGFTFLWEEWDALLNTLRWAVNTYRDRPEAWQAMQKRGMQRDFSWKRSANIYKDLYQEILE